MASKRFRSGRESDPIAELARLIAQADSHEGSAPGSILTRLSRDWRDLLGLSIQNRYSGWKLNPI